MASGAFQSGYQFIIRASCSKNVEAFLKQKRLRKSLRSLLQVPVIIPEISLLIL